MKHILLAATAIALTLAACERREPAPPADPAAQAPQPAAPAPAVPAQPAPPAATPAPTPPAPEPQATDKWRDYAKPADVDRLSRLTGAWGSSLAKARDTGHGAELARLGALVDPKAATLANPHPGPGAYRCRTVKLGGGVGFVTYPWFKCEIELTPGGDLILRKLTGSQRQEGMFYPDTDRRLVYLGGQAWGADEARASRYGDVVQRDQIGVLERIGDQRWRLAMPWSRTESDLDLLELAR